MLEALTTRDLDVDERQADPLAVVQHPFAVHLPTHGPRVLGARAGRTRSKDVPCAAGSAPTDALQIAVTPGNDSRADYTQGDYDWKHEPTAAARADAAHYTIKGSGARRDSATFTASR